MSKRQRRKQEKRRRHSVQPRAVSAVASLEPLPLGPAEPALEVREPVVFSAPVAPPVRRSSSGRKRPELLEGLLDQLGVAVPQAARVG